MDGMTELILVVGGSSVLEDKRKDEDEIDEPGTEKPREDVAVLQRKRRIAREFIRLEEAGCRKGRTRK